jgi:hypothetical protein
MSYELVTPKSHPDVLRHWEFFKKIFENMCHLGNIWEEFNISIDQKKKWQSDELTPSTYWIKGEYKGYSKNLMLEFLSNNTSMYFRITEISKEGILYGKKGQAFADNENNAELIFDVSNFLFNEFETAYKVLVDRHERKLKEDIQLNIIVEQMKSDSGNVLTGKASGGVADLRIVSDNKKISNIQVRGTARGKNKELVFNINLLDITSLQAARIAKVLAEDT